MSLFRLFVGLPAAALITAGLFFAMSEMIKNRGVDTEDPVPPLELKITADEPPGDQLEIKKPKKLPDTLPETVIDIPERSGKPTGPVVLPEGKPKIEGELPGAGGISSPTVRIAPPYPEGCRSKGAEGVVVVEFDVTPEGNVTNVRVTSSPDRCFDRPVRRAVSQWKYPPARNNGRPVMRYGVVEVFNFQLVD